MEMGEEERVQGGEVQSVSRERDRYAGWEFGRFGVGTEEKRGVVVLGIGSGFVGEV